MYGATADSVAVVLPLLSKSTQQHTRRLIFVLIVSFLWSFSLQSFMFPFC